MNLTEKEIIYPNDNQFELIKQLCHLSKNLYNASLYDVRQYYFKTKSYRNWKSQRPIFTKSNNPDYYALHSHLASEVFKQVGEQFIGFFNNKSNKNKRIPKYKNNEVAQPKLRKDNSKYFSIDPGLNNIVSIYNNIGIRPLLYNGRPIKSINQYYNKINSKLRSKLPANIKNSKRLKQLPFKRNNKINYELHKISKHIINEAIKNDISKIFIGNNINWKNGINIGQKNNQNFINIPHTKLFHQLSYKGLLNGIDIIFTEESYTSKASFFDKDELLIYGETTNPNFSGKRIKRGLYKDSKNNIWNADLNGAANIMRKCSSKAYINIRKTKKLMKRPLLITL